MSVFGDQAVHGEEAEEKGFGRHIPFQDLTFEVLKRAISDVLIHKSYSSRAKEVGQLLVESMESPMDKAIWWIEHAIKYPGLKHWHSPVHSLNWFQYFMLDVILFLVFIISTIIVFAWFFIKFLMKKVVNKVKTS